jgi:hypothetical protein
MTPLFSTEPSVLVPVRIGAEPRDREGRGEIVVELTIKLADSSAQAVRVSIPPGCDEASIRRVLRAIAGAGDGGLASC